MCRCGVRWSSWRTIRATSTRRLVGGATRRQLSYLARDTLFRRSPGLADPVLRRDPRRSRRDRPRGHPGDAQAAQAGRRDPALPGRDTVRGWPLQPFKPGFPRPGSPRQGDRRAARDSRAVRGLAERGETAPADRADRDALRRTDPRTTRWPELGDEELVCSWPSGGSPRRWKLARCGVNGLSGCFRLVIAAILCGLVFPFRGFARPCRRMAGLRIAVL